MKKKISFGNLKNDRISEVTAIKRCSLIEFLLHKNDEKIINNNNI